MILNLSSKAITNICTVVATGFRWSANHEKVGVTLLFKMKLVVHSNNMIKNSFSIT